MDSGINAYSCILDLIGSVKITSAELQFPTSDPNVVEDIVEASFVNEHGVTGQLFYNWVYIGDRDKCLYDITFKSGTKVSFEWCSGDLIVTHPDNTVEKSIVEVRVDDVDKSPVPMAREYFLMVGEAAEFFSKADICDDRWLYPLIAVLDTYAISKHIRNK